MRPFSRAHLVIRILFQEVRNHWAIIQTCSLRHEAATKGIGLIVEMRTYKLKAGMRPRFLEIFRTKSVPAHAEIGMKIVGPFLSIEDPDTFFFMRGFPDLESRESMKAKFYEGQLWKRELENIVMPMIEQYQVVLVDDPDNQIRW